MAKRKKKVLAKPTPLVANVKIKDQPIGPFFQPPCLRSMTMASTVATPANTTASKEAFHKAIDLLWNGNSPSCEDRSPGGQWFQWSVRHPQTAWAVLASTRTYGELVAHMAKVAEMGILPEGTMISAGRCYDYCQYDGSYREQTFLLSQVGREVTLEARR